MDLKKSFSLQNMFSPAAYVIPFDRKILRGRGLLFFYRIVHSWIQVESKMSSAKLFYHPKYEISYENQINYFSEITEH